MSSKRDSPRAIYLIKEFETLAENKLNSKREKYGPLVGDSDWNLINRHLIDEFAEWFLAMYGKEWETYVTLMIQYILNRLDENSTDVETELFDIHNLVKLIYMVGKVQGKL